LQKYLVRKYHIFYNIPIFSYQKKIIFAPLKKWDRLLLKIKDKNGKSQIGEEKN